MPWRSSPAGEEGRQWIGLNIGMIAQSVINNTGSFGGGEAAHAVDQHAPRSQELQAVGEQCSLEAVEVASNVRSVAPEHVRAVAGDTDTRTGCVDEDAIEGAEWQFGMREGGIGVDGGHICEALACHKFIHHREASRVAFYRRHMTFAPGLPGQDGGLSARRGAQVGDRFSALHFQRQCC